MRSQGTPPRTEVQPNTLTGEAEPNTLSSMAGRPASGWTQGGGQGPAGRPRPGAAPRSMSSPVLRLVSWVVLLIVAFAILSELGR